MKHKSTRRSASFLFDFAAIASTSFSVAVPFASAADAKTGTQWEEEGKSKDYPTKPFWSLSKSPNYRTLFPIDSVRDVKNGCDNTAKAPTYYSVGPKSIFKVYEQDEKSKTVQFTTIYYDAKRGKEGLPDLDSAYLLCMGDKLDSRQIPDYEVKRAGGLNTGVLIVPFKFRPSSGDLTGDSTIGPYISMSGASLSALVTFGISQITVADTAKEDATKQETGITGALGLVWSITGTFDVGFLVGVDHLSGSDKAGFKYQDKPWISASIGYNFTGDLKK